MEHLITNIDVIEKTESTPNISIEEEEDQQLRDEDDGNEDEDTEDKHEEQKYVYRDHAAALITANKRIQPTGMHPEDIKSDRDIKKSMKSFPFKLYLILSNPIFSHIISWLRHGRSWKIHSVPLLVQAVLPMFFYCANYNSFIRLVNAWSFRRIKRKSPRRREDHNSYYHELFLRGLPQLIHKMSRLPKTLKKLPMDKSAEPVFKEFPALPELPSSETASPPPVLSTSVDDGHAKVESAGCVSTRKQAETYNQLHDRWSSADNRDRSCSSLEQERLRMLLRVSTARTNSFPNSSVPPVLPPITLNAADSIGDPASSSTYGYERMRSFHANAELSEARAQALDILRGEQLRTSHGLQNAHTGFSNSILSSQRRKPTNSFPNSSVPPVLPNVLNATDSSIYEYELMRSLQANAKLNEARARAIGILRREQLLTSQGVNSAHTGLCNDILSSHQSYPSRQSHVLPVFLNSRIQQASIPSLHNNDCRSRLGDASARAHVTNHQFNENIDNNFEVLPRQILPLPQELMHHNARYASARNLGVVPQWHDPRIDARANLTANNNLQLLGEPTPPLSQPELDALGGPNYA